MVSNCSQPYQVDHVANDSIDISMSNLNFTLLQVQSLCAFHGKEKYLSASWHSPEIRGWLPLALPFPYPLYPLLSTSDYLLPYSE